MKSMSIVVNGVKITIRRCSQCGGKGMITRVDSDSLLPPPLRVVHKIDCDRCVKGIILEAERVKSV